MKFKHFVLLIIVFILCSCSRTDESNADKTNTKDFSEAGEIGATNDASQATYRYYRDKESEIIFKYSQNLSLNTYNEEGIKLSVESKRYQKLEGLMGFDVDTAMRNMENLQNGSFGEEVDFPFEETKKLRELKNINAQEFLVLNRFDICDVRFEKVLYFFSSENQVIIRLSMDPLVLKNSYPKYFERDEDNCSGEQIWDKAKQREFVSLFSNNEIEGVLKEFESHFQVISGSLESFDHSQEQKENLSLLYGDWISVDDEKSGIRITKQEKIDLYEGEEVKRSDLSIIKDPETGFNYMLVQDGDIEFKYTIMDLSEQELELMFLPRGNILKYKK